jgi:hypothetical protein
METHGSEVKLVNSAEEMKALDSLDSKTLQ